MRRALLIALVLLPLAAAIAPPGAGVWQVQSDTTLENVPFVLAQDVVVMPGATLRLKNVDALVARPLNVTVLGALEVVEGTRLATAAFPFDVYIAPGARLLASDATLAGARIVVAGDARAEASMLTSGALLVLSGGAAEAVGTSFDAAIGPAAHVRAGGALRLANASVGRTGDYGVRVEGGSATIENTTFALSPAYALYGRGAAITLVDSTFATHCGAFLVDGTHGLVARNVFTTLDHGVSVVSAGWLKLRDNVFDGTQEALLTFGGATEAERNVFTSNDIAVHVLFGSTSAPALHNSSFDGNGIAAWNEASASLDARWSWWGSAAGPAPGDTSGNVLASPWLVAAP